MFNEVYPGSESAHNSRLLALFNTLAEDEKDMVITMSESLVKKGQGYLAKTRENTIGKTNDFEHRW